MFFPNTRANLHRRSATKDNFGRFSYAAGVSVPCAVIYLDVKVEKSSVRADTSGSRGQAEQEQGDSRLLFPANLEIAKGDVIFIDDLWLEAIEIEKRRNVIGKVDHKQGEFRKTTAV